MSNLTHAVVSYPSAPSSPNFQRKQPFGLAGAGVISLLASPQVSFKFLSGDFPDMFCSLNLGERNFEVAEK